MIEEYFIFTLNDNEGTT